MTKKPYELIDDKYNECIKFFSINKVRNQKDIITEIMIDYIVSNPDNFFKVSNGINGVYFISNYYIGRTSNIYYRMAYHIIDGYPSLRKSNTNIDKANLIESEIRSGIIKVNIISNKQEDEEKLIIKYSKKYNLTNKEFNPNYTYLPTLNQKTVIKISSSSIENDFPDKANLTEFVELYQKINFTGISVCYDSKRMVVIVSNSKTKRVGVYTTKSKISFISSYISPRNLNKKLISDYQKYGHKSFTFEFIPVDEYKEYQLELINKFIDDGYDLYNHSIPNSSKEIKLKTKNKLK
jgi:hypothetical protein